LCETLGRFGIEFAERQKRRRDERNPNASEGGMTGLDNKSSPRVSTSLPPGPIMEERMRAYLESSAKAYKALVKDWTAKG